MYRLEPGVRRWRVRVEIPYRIPVHPHRKPREVSRLPGLSAFAGRMGKRGSIQVSRKPILSQPPELDLEGGLQFQNRYPGAGIRRAAARGIRRMHPVRKWALGNESVDRNYAGRAGSIFQGEFAFLLESLID